MNTAGLFVLPTDAPVANKQKTSTYFSKLKTAAGDIGPRATSVSGSTTNQPMVSATGVVLSSEDSTIGASPVVRLRVIVETVQGVEGALDAIATKPPCLLTTRKTSNPKDEKVALPRTFDGGVKAAPLTYIETSYFKGAKDEGLSAAGVPPGSRIKMTGVTAVTSKKTGHAFFNIKRYDVLDACTDPSDAYLRVYQAISRASFQNWQALELAGVAGGLSGLLDAAPLIGTDMIFAADAFKQALASGLDATVAAQQSALAGAGEAFETRVLDDVTSAAFTARAAELRELDREASFITIHQNGDVPKVPIATEARPPSSDLPSSVEFVTELDTGAKFSAVPVVTQVQVKGKAIEMFVSFVQILPGQRALQAIEAGMEAVYGADPITPGIAIKGSLKSLAVTLGTKSTAKATMAANEMLPYAAFCAVVPAHPREAGDSIFTDGAGGLNFADFFSLDMPSTLAMMALPVSAEFVKAAYGGGEATLTPEDIDPADEIPPPTGFQVPPVPSLKRSAYVAISESITALNKLDGPRLPVSKQTLTFRVVFDGVADAIKHTPSLGNDVTAAEAYLTNKFKATPDGTTLEQLLMSNTLLYAVAIGEPKRPREEPSSSDGSGTEDTPPSVQQASEPAEPAKKKAKK